MTFFPEGWSILEIIIVCLVTVGVAGLLPAAFVVIWRELKRPK